VDLLVFDRFLEDVCFCDKYVQDVMFLNLSFEISLPSDKVNFPIELGVRTDHNIGVGHLRSKVRVPGS
jgi:hypothetical protein